MFRNFIRCLHVCVCCVFLVIYPLTRVKSVLFLSIRLLALRFSVFLATQLLCAYRLHVTFVSTPLLSSYLCLVIYNVSCYQQSLRPQITNFLMDCSVYLHFKLLCVCLINLLLFSLNTLFFVPPVLPSFELTECFLSIQFCIFYWRLSLHLFIF